MRARAAPHAQRADRTARRGAARARVHAPHPPHGARAARARSLIQREQQAAALAGNPSLVATAAPISATHAPLPAPGAAVRSNGANGSGAGPSSLPAISNAEANAQLAKQGPSSWLKFM